MQGYCAVLMNTASLPQGDRVLIVDPESGAVLRGEKADRPRTYLDALPGEKAKEKGVNGESRHFC